MNLEIPAFHSLTRLPLRTGRSRTPFRMMAVVVLFFLTALAGGEALAKTEYQPGAKRFDLEPAHTSGDIRNAAICPKGEYVVGFEVRIGDWIDRIAIRCAKLLSTGLLGVPHTVGGQGGGGGGPATSECEEGLVNDIHFQAIIGNSAVRSINGECFNPAGEVENGKRFSLVGHENNGASFHQRCPVGMAATGLQVLWGKYVNAIGLICDKNQIPVPPPAPCPPGQNRVNGKCQLPASSRMLFCQGGGMPLASDSLTLVALVGFKAAPQSSTAAIPARGECAWQNGPIAANEPKRLLVQLSAPEARSLLEAAKNGGIFLVHGSVRADGIRVDKIDSVNVGFVPGPGPQKQGLAKAETVAPQVAGFAGQWNAVADGVSYSMTMKVQGSVVSGSFRGADGSNGKFSGAPKGNILRFSWDQTDGNGGTGKFVLSADGKSFKGSYNFGSNPDAVEGAWIGTKK